jgi:hypothetical protein
VAFGARFVIALAAVGAAQYWAMPKEKGLTLTSTNYFSIGLISFVLAVADYAKDEIARKNRGSGGDASQIIIFQTIAGAIERATLHRKQTKKTPEFYFTDMLRHVESIVKVLLGQSEAQGVRISANIMTVEESVKGWPFLRLKFWGTRLDGRDDISLPIILDDPLPGAPAAYVTQKTIYIENTMAREYSGNFASDKDYRCILSIPIFLPIENSHPSNSTKCVCAVLNIDANKEKIFESEDFISQTLMPAIKPVINLIVLECDLLKR